MKEVMRQRRKNFVTYLVCLCIAIIMWLGQNIEEQANIKKMYQREEKVKEKLLTKEEPQTPKKTKKIVNKKIESDSISTDSINPMIRDTTKTIQTTTVIR